MGRSIVFTRAHESEQLGIHDNRSEKLSAGLHQLDVFVMEGTWLNGLNHQNAGRSPLHHQGSGQERGEALLTRLREIAEPSILSGSFEGNRLAVLRHPSDQTVAHTESHMADRSRIKPDRGAQQEGFALGLPQIDRADVGIQALGDQIGNIRERLL